MLEWPWAALMDDDGASVKEMLVAPRVEVMEDITPLDAMEEEELTELVLVRCLGAGWTTPDSVRWGACRVTEDCTALLPDARDAFEADVDVCMYEATAVPYSGWARIVGGPNPMGTESRDDDMPLPPAPGLIKGNDENDCPCGSDCSRLEGGIKGRPSNEGMAACCEASGGPCPCAL